LEKLFERPLDAIVRNAGFEVAVFDAGPSQQAQIRARFINDRKFLLRSWLSRAAI
jgi:hypothetical protein